MSATTAGSRRGKSKQRGEKRTKEATGASGGDDNRVSTWLDAQKLTVLGTACLTLVALGLLFASVLDFGSAGNDDRSAEAPERMASAPSGQPPDLSTMTPREAAIRLFNRVMMADEQGNADEVAQFAPMAVAAFNQLESLDLDAFFHLGMIHAAAGDAESALNAAERMQAVVPGHLLASVLEHRVAVDENDQDRAARAIERFETNYDKEIKVDRPEYRHFQRLIDHFRIEIDGATGAGS
ncbi:MAG: hypothetical protein AAGA21_03680 [Pseudomonadota bacterium]